MKYLLKLQTLIRDVNAEWERTRERKKKTLKFLLIDHMNFTSDTPLCVLFRVHCIQLVINGVACNAKQWHTNHTDKLENLPGIINSVAYFFYHPNRMEKCYRISLHSLRFLCACWMLFFFVSSSIHLFLSLLYSVSLRLS